MFIFKNIYHEDESRKADLFQHYYYQISNQRSMSSIINTYLKKKENILKGDRHRETEKEDAVRKKEDDVIMLSLSKKPMAQYFYP